MSATVTWIFLCAVTSLVCGELNPYLEALSKRPWQSVQKYVEVRPGAHLFYWLYYADGTHLRADHKPLVIWIQGGPGLAASGLANFAEIGPLNMDFQPRNYTWMNGKNVLLIDHPVGTGFSYADDKSLYVKTDREMAMDLSKAIKAFYRDHKEFRRTPTYIFGQSYGGKLCPRLAYYLHTAIKKKSLKMNLKGIGIGSGWVDPKESSLVFPNFLYNMGIIDQHAFLAVTNMTRDMCNYIDRQDYATARKLESLMLQILVNEAEGEINFNNVNQVTPYPALDRLAVKVNRYVKPTLSHVVKQSLEWNYRSEECYDQLTESFLVPSTKFLEMILNTTDLKVTVYNGNLDIVTPLAGASNWVHKLKWFGSHEFKDTRRVKIQGTRNGFYKKAHRLSFWSVFGSGHWVPEDNPEAMQQILEDLMSE